MLQPNSTPCHFLGCDVGKKSITLFSTRDQFAVAVPNTPKDLRRALRHYPAHALVAEATGGYEAVLLETAVTANLIAYRVHPSRAAAFTRCIGHNAKTDPLDAKALAAYGKTHQDLLKPWMPPTLEERELTRLARRRDELVNMRTQERNRLKAPDNHEIRSSIEAVLTCLDTQLEVVEARMKEVVSASARLQHKVDVLTAVCGVGTVTAHNLLANLPEIGMMKGREISALAGLAPLARDSGNKTGYRSTRSGGRQDVRRLLYMAALSAARRNEKLKAFYDRLINQNHKKPMVALIAVAHKLLLILNAKLRDADSLAACVKQS